MTSLSFRTARHGLFVTAALLLTASANAQEAAPAAAGAPPPEASPPAAAENAPEAPSGRIGLFVNPISMAFGAFGGEVDVRLASFVSLNVVGQYLKQGDASAIGANLGAQFFLSRPAFRGWYVYPQVPIAFASASTVDANGNSVTGHATGIGIGATGGYQWNWSFGLALRLGLGAGYRTISASATDGTASAYGSMKGVMPLIDAALGWTF